MLLGEGQRHVAAHRVADERAAFDAQRPQSRGHRVGEELHRVGLARHHRDAVSRQVECHDAHLLVEIGYEVVPDEQRFEVAVQQHDATVSGLRVADVQGGRARHDEFFGHNRS